MQSAPNGEHSWVATLKHKICAHFTDLQVCGLGSSHSFKPPERKLAQWTKYVGPAVNTLPSFPKPIADGLYEG